MNLKKRLTAAALCICTGIMPLCIRASAAEEQTMTFAVRPGDVYFAQKALSSESASVRAQMDILNYTGFSQLRLQLISDEPLTVENGDFTRDPSQKDTDGMDLPSFFTSHGTTIYTGRNDAGELKNICLWYGPGNVVPLNGVIRDASSSFLTFDVMIPAGTAAGVYQVGFATGQTVNAAGQPEDDLFLYDENGEELPVPALKPMRVIVEPEALRGDANCDGKIDLKDAQSVSKYYSMNDLLEEEPGTFEETALGTPYIHTALEAANVFPDGAVDLRDVQRIMKYYNKTEILEEEADWDDL